MLAESVEILLDSHQQTAQTYERWIVKVLKNHYRIHNDAAHYSTLPWRKRMTYTTLDLSEGYRCGDLLRAREHMRINLSSGELEN